MARERFAPGITVVKTGAIIALSATSASVAIPTNSSGVIPTWIRVSSTMPAAVRLSKGASTAVATDLNIQPGDAIVLRATGFDTVSALQVAMAGVVQISPLEDS